MDDLLYYYKRGGLVFPPSYLCPWVDMRFSFLFKGGLLGPDFFLFGLEISDFLL